MPPPQQRNNIPTIINTISSELNNDNAEKIELLKCAEKAWTGLNRVEYVLSRNIIGISMVSQDNIQYNVFSYIVDSGLDELIKQVAAIPGNNPLARNLVTLLLVVQKMPLNSTKVILLIICTNISLKLLYKFSSVMVYTYDLTTTTLGTIFVMMNSFKDFVFFKAIPNQIKNLTDLASFAAGGAIDARVVQALDDVNKSVDDKGNNGYVQQSINELATSFASAHTPVDALKIALGGQQPGNAGGAEQTGTEEQRRYENWWIGGGTSGGLRRQRTLGPTTCPDRTSRAGGALKTKKSKPKSSKGKSKKHLKIKKSKKSKNSTKKKVQRKKSKKPLSASRRSQ